MVLGHFLWKKLRRFVLHVVGSVIAGVAYEEIICGIIITIEDIFFPIHHEQCFEVELEKRLCGTDVDLVRTKLNADEQMCCNICRIPIIDYHRHCANCSYDLCLHCCQDLRAASKSGVGTEVNENQIDGRIQDKETLSKLVIESQGRINLSDKYQGWKANNDGSIPCPPKGARWL
ncbi:hypothetical protein OIU77_018516 [Salix suchowensis]|uniref:Uncharacterized protein n=1 Tax=Salix suchowensis TaxID=1278906 RepID=A0ABQ9CCQ3_9ROSI|nr:hypothetical protein OIU77_018516 [Salix suchowensis]